MRLVRSIIVALAGVLAAGCSDATAPPQRVTALYVLESIGGQLLPATFSPSPIETATVLWGTVNLDARGNATVVERRLSASTTYQRERTIARLTPYEIDAETITIGHTCVHHPLASCAPTRVGQITGSMLTLSTDFGRPPVYLYRLAVTE